MKGWNYPPHQDQAEQQRLRHAAETVVHRATAWGLMVPDALSTDLGMALHDLRAALGESFVGCVCAAPDVCECPAMVGAIDQERLEALRMAEVALDDRR